MFAHRTIQAFVITAIAIHAMPAAIELNGCEPEWPPVRANSDERKQIINQAKASPLDLIKKIERRKLRKGRKSGTTWFHPRPCLIPGPNGRTVLMTLQSISGSDVFGPVHWTTKSDLGKTWSKFTAIPGWGRHALPDGLREGTCDVVPQYHPKTRTVLAIGHNVFYKNDRLVRPQPPRFPVYTVRDKGGKWSEPRKLVWNDPRGTLIYTCGCGQRLTLPSGDVLIPISFAPKGRTDRAVTTLLCSFDGKHVKVKKAGNELRNPVRRGLLEPSLAYLDGRYYMTIRAEDGRGYVTQSKDGLNWGKPIAWKWDNGVPLTMSTTQQHWLTHSDALYLVYTRKAKENANVFRWRAPLYTARVDRKTLRLIRSTERVVLPMIGVSVKKPHQVARMGNFHTTAVSPYESWVTVGETIPNRRYRGDLLLARIIWNRANRFAAATFGKTGQQPYPASKVIRSIVFDWATRKDLAPGSDNWPITWGKDGQQYTSWGDGGGFGGTNRIGRVSLGVARVIGGWKDYRGRNLWGGAKSLNRATFGGKSYGVLAVGDTIYMWLRQVDGTHAKLAYSKDAGKSWRKSNWHFPPGQHFNTGTFLQFGPGYTKSRDNYVYSYFIRTENGNFGFVVHKPGKIDLASVPKDRVLKRDAYEFFAGFNANGQPIWTRDVKKRRPVFQDARGVSWVLSVTYNAGLKRYLLTTEHTRWQCGNIGIFDAPQPWGPWTTVPYNKKFPGWTFAFSNKWTSDDSKRFTVIFTPRDNWATVRGRFILFPPRQQPKFTTLRRIL